MLKASATKRFGVGYVSPENDSITIPRNVDNYSPNDTASHPRRTESSATL